jgi:hypothetical protein
LGACAVKRRFRLHSQEPAALPRATSARTRGHRNFRHFSIADTRLEWGFLGVSGIITPRVIPLVRCSLSIALRFRRGDPLANVCEQTINRVVHVVRYTPGRMEQVIQDLVPRFRDVTTPSSFSRGVRTRQRVYDRTVGTNGRSHLLAAESRTSSWGVGPVGWLTLLKDS